jgi:sulfite reductase alpha subunit-like flavoprotein
MGAMKLFFGCRHPDEDFLYKRELLQLHEQGTSLSLARIRKHPRTLSDPTAS